jgi:hypothetical protein
MIFCCLIQKVFMEQFYIWPLYEKSHLCAGEPEQWHVTHSRKSTM